jgi:two-component system phosphate regulon sensor histidine kinase PhoR
MKTSLLDRIAALIRLEREALLRRWRHQVRQLPSAKDLDVPTLNDHMPNLLEELAVALESDNVETIPEDLAQGSPPAHGMQRVEDGFDIIEVVAEYNILRTCIHDLATTNELNLQGQPFRVINRVLDEAIGLAVQTFAAERALDVRRRREEYLAFVAHDIRTPLNAIALAVKVLEVQHPVTAANAPTSQMLHSLKRNTKQIAAMVAKVLEENENLETEIGCKLERRFFDLWPLVEALVHDLQPLAGPSRTQLLNRIPDDLTAFADAALVKRIFQNLITNAIRYTVGGHVTIEARDLGAGVGIECTVRDDGTGIAADFIHQIFAKGETDPDAEGRTGLGLAIVKTFVEAHGGAVAVETKEGQGSAFRFTLPAKGA